MDPGARVIFIPFAPGIFCPLNIYDFSSDDKMRLLNGRNVNYTLEKMKNGEKSIQNNFVLDLASLNPSHREFLEYIFN